MALLRASTLNGSLMTSAPQDNAPPDAAPGLRGSVGALVGDGPGPRGVRLDDGQLLTSDTMEANGNSRTMERSLKESLIST